MKNPPKRILVIEDQKVEAQAIRFKLIKSGYDVSVANSGEEAIVLLKQNSYDLILLDLLLPRVNGFYVMSEIKALKIKSPVIVISNLSQEKDIKEAKELGAAHYLIKSNKSLREIIEELEKFLKQ